MVVYQGEYGTFDAIGGDEKMFRIVVLRTYQLRDCRMVDEYLTHALEVIGYLRHNDLRARRGTGHASSGLGGGAGSPLSCAAAGKLILAPEKYTPVVKTQRAPPNHFKVAA